MNHPFHSCIYYNVIDDEYQKFKLIASSSNSDLLKQLYHFIRQKSTAWQVVKRKRFYVQTRKDFATLAIRRGLSWYKSARLRLAEDKPRLNLTEPTEITENGSVTKAVFAANPLGESPLFFVYGIFRFLSVFWGADFRLITFAHLAYHFFAHFAHITAFVPTYKIVEQQKFFIFKPDGSGDIVVHNVGYEKLR